MSTQTQEQAKEPIALKIPSKGYAAMAASQDLVPFDFSRRIPGPHDVHIEIKYCGICHSDLHQVRNEWGNSMYPMVPGHEMVGKILKVGDHVKKFEVGESVGIGCLVNSCRECESCKEGLEQFCTGGLVPTYNGMDKDGTVTYGGYSNQIICDEDFVLHVSDKLPLEKAAPLLCAGITTYSPLMHWKVGKGTKMAVVGLGGLGHMAVKIGAALGADVTVISTHPAKEKDAIHLGAHNFILSTDPEQAKSVVGKFNFVIDTVSAKHDHNFYLNLLRHDGVMVLVGLPPDPAVVPSAVLVFGRKSLAGSPIGGIAETQEMLDFCADHNITSDIELIPFKDINKAFIRMENSDVKYRFVIDMSTL